MTISDEIKERAQKLEADLDADMRYERALAKADYWIAIMLMLITLASSFAAGIGALGFQWTIRTTGIVAFIPGAIAILATTLKFEGKSNWHYRKLYGLSSLKQRLKYELPAPMGVDHVAAISKEHRDLIVKMEQEWETSLSLSWSQFKQHPV